MGCGDLGGRGVSEGKRSFAAPSELHFGWLLNEVNMLKAIW